MAIEKIKILGASEVGPNGLNWQCCLAGSSKTAPRILIFSIAIGADYSFDIKSGFSIAPAFSLHNNFDIASVSGDRLPNHAEGHRLNGRDTLSRKAGLRLGKDSTGVEEYPNQGKLHKISVL